MLNPLPTDFAEATAEAARATHHHARTLSHHIDYLNDMTKANLPSFAKYFGTYEFYLSFEMLCAGSNTYKSLACIEHVFEWAQRMKPVANKLFAEAQKHALPSDLRGLDRILEEHAAEESLTRAFFQVHRDVIEQQHSTEEYQRDRAIITRIFNKLEETTKTGIWKPEYVTVKDLETGQPRQAELPHSSRMGEIAAMAPKFQKLGFGV